MITFIQGSNLFDSAAQVVVNTVNCVGIMGKGVALEFKKRYPAMFEDYQARCAAKTVTPGVPYLWEDDRSVILNFPTKAHWKENSKLEYIERGLQWLASSYESLGIHTIAMPALGCGNGGLDWKDVRLLLEHYLGSLPDLEVFAYEPSGAASEKSTDDEDRKTRTLDSDLRKPAASPNL